MAFQDHFSARAEQYARARPSYPDTLFADLAGRAPTRAQAWDAGTGNGQAALGLAAHFSHVLATDPSAPQLARAEAHPGVTYRQAAEDGTGLPDRSTDLVTAAQAAHWFDLTRFSAEARRVLRPGGVVAIWCYGLCNVSSAIDEAVARFYHEEVGPCWPPDRRHVEDGYRSLLFPFAESPFPAHQMTRRWTCDDFLGYLRTWSAVERYQRERGADPVAPFAVELGSLWGTGERLVRWPLSGRLGRLA